MNNKVIERYYELFGKYKTILDIAPVVVQIDIPYKDFVKIRNGKHEYFKMN